MLLPNNISVLERKYADISSHPIRYTSVQAFAAEELMAHQISISSVWSESPRCILWQLILRNIYHSCLAFLLDEWALFCPFCFVGTEANILKVIERYWHSTRAEPKFSLGYIRLCRLPLIVTPNAKSQKPEREVFLSLGTPDCAPLLFSSFLITL